MMGSNRFRYRDKRMSANETIFPDFSSIKNSASNPDQGSITDFTTVKHDLHESALHTASLVK